MVRKLCTAALLMTMAGVASAKDDCSFFWFCSPSRPTPTPMRAPEIDPASAMAGLTMLAGGLAVLRGRRRIPTKE
jgi:hypothetical protein